MKTYCSHPMPLKHKRAYCLGCLFPRKSSLLYDVDAVMRLSSESLICAQLVHQRQVPDGRTGSMAARTEIGPPGNDPEVKSLVRSRSRVVTTAVVNWDKHADCLRTGLEYGWTLDTRWVAWALYLRSHGGWAVASSLTSELALSPEQ